MRGGFLRYTWLSSQPSLSSPEGPVPLETRLASEEPPRFVSLGTILVTFLLLFRPRTKKKEELHRNQV